MTKYSRTGMIAAIMAGTCLTSPVLAQSAAADAESAAQSDALGSIIVTARKSSESLQEVPLAITAVTSELLEKANVREVRDIATLTPGLTISGDGQERNQQPAIRGISFAGGNETEGNVAVMLDGIYMANPNGLSLGLMELERVEVVKGPQSSLYGRNAFAGAINYVPKAPPSEFDAKVQLKAGSYGWASAMGSVGGSIVDGLITARIAAKYDKASGSYTDSVNRKDIGGWKKKDVDLAIRVTPSDRLTVDLGGYYGDDLFGLPLQVSFPANCGNNRSYCGELPSTKSVELVASTIEPSESVGNDRQVRHVRAKVSYDLDAAVVTANFGHFNIKQHYYNDIFGVRDGLLYNLVGTDGAQAYVNGFFGGYYNTKDYSAEMRIASQQNQPLRWAAGGYFYKIKQTNLIKAGFNAAQIPAGREIVCPRNFACMWLTPDGNPSDISGDSRSQTRQLSAFGSLTYDFTEKLTAGAELRYTQEKKRRNVLSNATSPGEDPDGPNGQRATFEYWNPKFTIDYNFSRNNMLYASVAKGTKSGGFNQSAIDPTELSFGPENNWTYEVGLKTMFFDNKVRLNVAAFYIDWTALQIEVPSRSQLIGNVTKNYGSVTVKGGEVELAVKVADGVTLNLGSAYSDPKFDKGTYDFDSVDFCLSRASCAPRVVTGVETDGGLVDAVDLSGLQRIESSKWQHVAGIDVEQPLAGDYTWFSSANYKYESKQYADILNTRWIGSRHTLTAQAGVKRDNMKLTVFVQNALNDLTAFSTSGGNGVTRYNNLSRVPRMMVPDKRRIGVSLDYSF